MRRQTDNGMNFFRGSAIVRPTESRGTLGRNRWWTLAFLAVVGLFTQDAGASSPGTCLQFNGSTGYVSVAHAPALNAYPLTITAWIKTLHSAPLYDGILSKYPPGGFDGFSFFVYQ